MIKVHQILYDEFKNRILNEDDNWVIVSTINFEECSYYFVKDILLSQSEKDKKRIKFLPLRLVSRRASPWSALEVVKDMFSQELISLSNQLKIDFNIIETEYPVGPEIVYNVLFQAKTTFRNKVKLVIDLSTMPREMATHFSTKICDINKEMIHENFTEVFIVITQPDKITNRNGLGPFSVGQPKFVFNQYLTNIITSKHKTNLLVFPGYEGFEAKLVIDTFSGHNTNITCAVNCTSNSYVDNLFTMIGNQSILMDVLQNRIDIRYYFSSFDILRVSLEFLDNAIKLFDEFPEYDHALLIAPFGPKAAIFISSYIGSLFKMECSKRNPSKEVITDIITLPVSQYVSLYSRGNKVPVVFNLRW